MKVFAILGHPVAHSLSPKLHNAVFQAMGLKDHVYQFYDCSPEKLKDAIQEMRQGKWEGFSVTIPYKQEVMKYVDVVLDIGESVGAVNTVWPEDNYRDVVATNTDYAGFLAALNESHSQNDPPLTSALVLGSGGAAQAVMAALKDLECKVTIASRSDKDGTVSYDSLNPDDNFELIVNTTPVGMGDGRLLLEDDRWYRSDRVYFDIVYSPRITPFLKKSQDAGAKIITGDRMFLWQAVEQAKIFTGREEVPVGVMEQVLASLAF
ncbi:MAG: shikimate dehydrogenase [Candidatus Altimarinota bacterium]